MRRQQSIDREYVLGHSDEELQRLVCQSRLFSALTEQVLIKAGIGIGMRVLDVGCGPGDVSFLAAGFVGPSGSVIGVDRSAEAIAVARERASAAQLRNVTFVEGDVSELSLEGSVDAAVGRFVLQHLPDPVAALRRIARQVEAGGVITFQEMDASEVKSLPRSPLFEQVGRWITETFHRGKVDVQLGLALYQIFRSAGLPAPHLIMGTRVEGGADSPAYEYIAQTVRSLLPMMEKLGVATVEEVQIDTLARRVRDEVVAGGGVIVLPHLVGAWARKP